MVKKKRVFVTVGTTYFNELIATVTKPETLEVLKNLGYTEIQLQTGNVTFDKVSDPTISVFYGTYFEDFEKQLETADLVISHGGAGSCLEVLRKKRPLIIVINENLMDNHQIELAEQLQSDGYAYYCTCNTLKDTLHKDLNLLKVYPTANKNLFSDYLDKCMGFL